jgi:antitoxin VapB
MPALVISNLPEDLYGRLRTAAAVHRRSVSQEVLSALDTAFPEPAPETHSAAESTLSWLREQVWPNVIPDDRHPDEIIGYDAHGRPG